MVTSQHCRHDNIEVNEAYHDYVLIGCSDCKTIILTMGNANASLGSTCPPPDSSGDEGRSAI